MLTLLEEPTVGFQLQLFIVRARVGLGGRCPSSSSASLLPPSPTPPGWNMKVEIFIEEEFLKVSTLVRTHSYSFIRTFIPSAYIY